MGRDEFRQGVALSCDLCKAIAVYGCPPEKRPVFNPACLHCGARGIQFIQRVLQIPRDVKAQRCRKALEHWMSNGHSEAEIRSLAKRQEWAVQRIEKGKK